MCGRACCWRAARRRGRPAAAHAPYLRFEVVVVLALLQAQRHEVVPLLCPVVACPGSKARQKCPLLGGGPHGWVAHHLEHVGREIHSPCLLGCHGHAGHFVRGAACHGSRHGAIVARFKSLSGIESKQTLSWHWGGAGAGTAATRTAALNQVHTSQVQGRPYLAASVQTVCGPGSTIAGQLILAP